MVLLRGAHSGWYWTAHQSLGWFANVPPLLTGTSHRLGVWWQCGRAYRLLPITLSSPSRFFSFFSCLTDEDCWFQTSFLIFFFLWQPSLKSVCKTQLGCLGFFFLLSLGSFYFIFNYIRLASLAPLYTEGQQSLIMSPPCLFQKGGQGGGRCRCLSV